MLESRQLSRSYQILCRRYGKVVYHTCWGCFAFQRLRNAHNESFSLADLHKHFLSLLSQSISTGDESILWHESRCNRLLGFWTAWEGPKRFVLLNKTDTAKLSHYPVDSIKWPQINALVVSTTHWDPEVHQPAPVMWLRLLSVINDAIDYLENEPKAPPFIFDGQVSPILDFLEVFPQHKSRLEALIKQERFIVGPWWTIPDLFHPTGETLVRNLLFGTIASQQLGNVMMAGYTPDPFGMIAQLPQILLGFGIDSCFTRRGIAQDLEENEFYWLGPDNSKVLGLHLRWGYRTIGLLPREPEEAVKAIKKVIERSIKYSSTSSIILMSGDNNVGIQKDLPSLIEVFDTLIPNVKFSFGTPLDFVKRIKEDKPDLAEITGELIGGRYQMHLTGCMSNRFVLKQKAVSAASRTEWQAEPLATLAWLLGFSYPYTPLKTSWIALVRNSFHDAITGTHVDSVSNDIINRYQNAEHISDAVIEQAISHIASQVEIKSEYGILVIFTSSQRSGAPLHVEVPSQFSDYTGLVDDRGEFFPIQLREIGNRNYLLFISPTSYGLGCRVLNPVKTIDVVNEKLIATNSKLRNPYVEIEILKDGEIKITNLNENNSIITNKFRSIGDRGDLFRSWLIEKDQCYSGKTYSRARLIENGPVRATIEAELSMKIPGSLADNRERRSQQMIEHKITSRVSIYADHPRIDFVIEFNNKSLDHLLQTCFILDDTYEHIHASQPFYTVARNLKPFEIMDDWIEQPGPGYFHSGFFRVGSWTFFAPGLHEYQFEEPFNLWLTLLRCVGIHGLLEMPNRAWNAGMPTPVPLAQNVGLHTISYSIVPENLSNSIAWETLKAIVEPPKSLFLQKQTGIIPSQVDFIKIFPADLVISAIKREEKGNCLIVRFFNASNKDIKNGWIKLSIPFTRAWKSNLAEERLKPIVIDDINRIVISASAYQIGTVLIEVDGMGDFF